MGPIKYVRDSETPGTFDGRWQVWARGWYWGIVRKGDPVTPGLEWGYEGPRLRCEAGFRTRQAAAEALLRDEA